jgi:hypothetical protein
MFEEQKVRAAARELADLLAEDIAKCTNRAEHIRVTARANAAAELVQMMESGASLDR